MICKACSLIESIIALNSSFPFSGRSSGTSRTVATRYGFSVITSAILKRFFPCMITVTLPSGIFKTLRMRATTPVVFISSAVGFSTDSSF